MRVPKYARCSQCGCNINHVVETTEKGHIINGVLYTWEQLLGHGLKNGKFAWIGFSVPAHDCRTEVL